jgi:hypothetical protein
MESAIELLVGLCGKRHATPPCPRGPVRSHTPFSGVDGSLSIGFRRSSSSGRSRLPWCFTSGVLDTSHVVVESLLLRQSRHADVDAFFFGSRSKFTARVLHISPRGRHITHRLAPTSVTPFILADSRATLSPSRLALSSSASPTPGSRGPVIAAARPYG